MGRVDLHSHILPSVDDGALDDAEALAIARHMVAAGYSDVVATPHCKPDIDPPHALVQQRMVEFTALLARENIPLRVHEGCENHLTAEFLDRVDRGNPRALGASAWVLVELPFSTPVPGLRDIVFRLRLKGLRPLIAHPERCAHFLERPGDAAEIIGGGAAFQIELGSLAGLYGGAAKRLARTLLDDGLVAIAATDAHRPHALGPILDSFEVLARAVGHKAAERLVDANPAAMLRGEPLPS